MAIELLGAALSDATSAAATDLGLLFRDRFQFKTRIIVAAGHNLGDIGKVGADTVPLQTGRLGMGGIRDEVNDAVVDAGLFVINNLHRPLGDDLGALHHITIIGEGAGLGYANRFIVGGHLVVHLPIDIDGGLEASGDLESIGDVGLRPDGIELLGIHLFRHGGRFIEELIEKDGRQYRDKCNGEVEQVFADIPGLHGQRPCCVFVGGMSVVPARPWR